MKLNLDNIVNSYWDSSRTGGVRPGWADHDRVGLGGVTATAVISARGGCPRPHTSLYLATGCASPAGNSR